MSVYIKRTSIKKRTNILKDYFVKRIFMSLPVYKAYQINVGTFHFKKLYP